ncbi:homoserine dehydrogenase, partial [filamentous cyanobacterium Phorm 46]
MAFKIGLLGLGTVGAGTAEILLSPDGRHSLLQELEIYRVGVRDISRTRSLQLPENVLTTDLEAIATDPEIDIVVE